MTHANLGESFLCAIKGLIWGISKDRNTKIHLLIGIIAIIFAILLDVSRIDFIIILFTSFLVITLELLNNGIEKLLDLDFKNYDGGCKKVKDLMAGIVLIADVFAVIIGFLVLYKPFINAMNINPFIPLIVFAGLNIILIPTILLLLLKEFNPRTS